MLREIVGLRQDEPELQRRWFHDDYFDLFVWQDPAGTVTAFELCYGNDSCERALVWKSDSGFFHDGAMLHSSEVSSEGRPQEVDPIATRFHDAAHNLPESIRAVLDLRIAEYQDARDNMPSRRKQFRAADWQQRRRETR